MDVSRQDFSLENYYYITCRPSKKLSPIMITVEPPVVQPSLGEIALMQGTADAG